MSNIGRMIYGYCGGYFGRDHYWDGAVVGEGEDLLVFLDTASRALACASIDGVREKLAFLEEFGDPKLSYATDTDEHPSGPAPRAPWRDDGRALPPL